MTPAIPPLPRLEIPEALAVRRLYDAAKILHGNPFGIATAEVGGAVGVALRVLPVPSLNRVVGLGVNRTAREDDVRSLASFYERATIERSMFQVAPDAETDDVRAWLTAAGYAPSGGSVKSFVELGAAATWPTSPASAVRVERIDAALATDWSETCLAGAGLPPELAPMFSMAVATPDWYHYLAFLDGRPVAAAALHVHDDTAWLGLTAVLREARGQGVRRALVEARLADARSLRCTLAVAETEDTPDSPALRELLACGFHTAYTRRHWIHGAG